MSQCLDESTRRFGEVLERSETFLLSGHVNIDGDSLGSMLAMHYFLRARGKRSVAICFEPLLDRYAFLGADGVVEVFDPARHGDLARDADCFMMFDFSSPSRMPGLWDAVRHGHAFKVCVDHHPADELPGDLNLHDVRAPATGKIVLDVIRDLGGPLDGKIAEALLVAISTDTGWFRYSNTSAHVLRDAADLLSVDGIDASRVYQEVYQRNEVALIRLMGRVAADIREELGGRLLWGVIPYALVNELGVGTFETDELLDLMRTGRDAECVALLRELEDGVVRVNLRSRGAVDVSGIAREIGGGGHLFAAGANLEVPLAAAAELVVGKLRAALDRAVRIGHHDDRTPAT
ncbi:MAG: DHH family phosphoesterase [Phycisphaerales bacterium]|nr:DHH family phosphoesterase [Phycisphaerales bacterium]